MSKTYNIPPTREEIKKRGAVGWSRVGYDIYIDRGMTKKAAWEGAFMHTCKQSEQIMRDIVKAKCIHLHRHRHGTRDMCTLTGVACDYRHDDRNECRRAKEHKATVEGG